MSRAIRTASYKSADERIKAFAKLGEASDLGVSAIKNLNSKTRKYHYGLAYFSTRPIRPSTNW